MAYGVGEGEIWQAFAVYFSLQVMMIKIKIMMTVTATATIGH